MGLLIYTSFLRFFQHESTTTKINFLTGGGGKHFYVNNFLWKHFPIKFVPNKLFDTSSPIITGILQQFKICV